MEGSIVGIGVTKPFFRTEYPPAAYLVPERFPPLRARLAAFSREALFHEIGKGFVAPRAVTYRADRDEIVIDELLSRGLLRDQEVRTLLSGAPEPGALGAPLEFTLRLQTVLDGIERRNEVKVCASALERVCRQLPTGQLQKLAVGKLFAAMVDFSHAPLDFLARDECVRTSLWYLRNNARDEETLKRLLNTRPLREGKTRKQNGSDPRVVNAAASRLDAP